MQINQQSGVSQAVDHNLQGALAGSTGDYKTPQGFDCMKEK